jgi:hypothetical protein
MSVEILDVVVKGQSLWPTFLVGLGGALIGALAVFGVELWRQVLEFRSAARVIEYELKANLNRCTQAILARRGDVQLLDEAWRSHRVNLAPLMSADAYMGISTSYDAVFIVQDWIKKLPTDEFEAAKKQLQDWMGQTSLHPALLIQVQKRKRLSQIIDALLSRPTWAPPVKGEDKLDGATRHGAQKGQTT